MKISNSKKQLAQLLIEAGVTKFPEGADWAAQGRVDLKASFYGGYKPKRGYGETAFCGNYCGLHHDVQLPTLIPNWHQSVLSRDEFDQIVAKTIAQSEPDADGWIEWKGGNIPVGFGTLVDVKLRGGNVELGQQFTFSDSWGHHGGPLDIIAYRLHKPDAVKLTDFGAIGDDETNLAVKDGLGSIDHRPTIEQLAADYRNAKDYADRKQQEADDAKDIADEVLRKLELAGEEIWLIVTPITAKQESDLVSEVKAGDEVECVESNVYREKYSGMIGTVLEVDDSSTPYLVDFGGEKRIWCHEVKFIRRP